MEVCQFKVKRLQQICFEVLKDHLCPENCIELWQFSNACFLAISHKLRYETFCFICENFEEVALCEEFLHLEVQELAQILGQDNLNVTQESTAYESVLRWIKHMPEERTGAIATLLPKVRLGLMDNSYIMENVLSNDIIQTNPESNLLVCSTLQDMSKPLLLRSELGINNTLFCRRLPNSVLLMFRSYSMTIDSFEYSSNNWLKVHTIDILSDPRPSFGFNDIVFLDGYLYIVGGCFLWSVTFNRVKKFNPATHTWQEVSSMQESREAVSVSVLKGCIYAMGGWDIDDNPLRTAEHYQPDSNQWTFIESMNEGRADASSTTLNNKIYTCGGRSFFQILTTAECYNPHTNQWTLITPMSTPRYQLGVVAYMGQIFAVGGIDGSKVLGSAEAYDPVTDTWHDVPEMVHSHRDFGIAVSNKHIFVVSCTPKHMVQCFDSTTNSWSVVFSAGDCYYDKVRLCVMSRVPNMAEYYSPREPVAPESLPY